MSRLSPTEQCLVDLAKHQLRKYGVIDLIRPDPPHIRALYTYPTSLRRDSKRGPVVSA